MRTMRAAIQFEANAPLQVVDGVEIDEPDRGEVLVRVTHCGVCQSDLGVAAGKLPYPRPVILGHEAAGHVAAVGEGVVDLKVGDLVVLSMRAPCGVCPACLSGQPVLCEYSGGPLNPKDRSAARTRVRYQGAAVIRGMRLGAFAEFVLVERSGVVAVSQPLEAEQACLVGCAVQTGFGSVFNIAAVRSGDTAAVFGLGAVGLSTVGALRLTGASKILALDINEHRRRQALTFGADVALDPAAAGFDQEVTALVEARGGFDHVFDGVGGAQTLATASRIVRKGGTLTVIGVAPPDLHLPVKALDIVMRQLSIRGSFLGNSHPQRDLPRYMDLCCGGRFDLRPLITKRRPLEEINLAFDELQQGVGIRTVLTL